MNKLLNSVVDIFTAKKSKQSGMSAGAKVATGVVALGAACWVVPKVARASYDAFTKRFIALAERELGVDEDTSLVTAPEGTYWVAERVGGARYPRAVRISLVETDTMHVFGDFETGVFGDDPVGLIAESGSLVYEYLRAGERRDRLVGLADAVNGDKYVSVRNGYVRYRERKDDIFETGNTDTDNMD
jgi:hypothetical protein